MTAPDGGRRSTCGCSSASRRDASFLNTDGPISDHFWATRSRTLAGIASMTPSRTSTHQDKIVAPAKQSSNQSAESGQEPLHPTNSNAGVKPEAKTAVDSNTESKSTQSTLARAYRLLPASGDAFHLIDNDDDTRPMCGAAGSFRTVPAAEARDRTRLCRNCETLDKGQVAARPCPKCDRSIRITRWPQHLRDCRGRSTESSDGDES